MSPTTNYLQRRLDRAVRWNEQRVGAATGIKATLRYVFPDHWSFMLGEIALYSFMVLIGTGIFLAVFYTASDKQVIYHGPYTLLQGQQMSEAYESVVHISFNVPAGLLFRQVHHWAANLFVASIVLHLIRVVFTGAYRKPRDLTYYIGLTMLMLAVLEGFAGYSLIDDLLSGMGLVIAYGVAMSIPLVGAQISFLIWDGPFPGSSAFFPRLGLFHILLAPIAIAILITLHLALVMRQHHSQFPGVGRRERNVVGTPMWPAYALRSIGLMFAVTGVLFLVGGLIQINPIWEWGPYHTYLSENAAQPDWYVGWLIGALRLMPNWEAAIGSRTIIPNPFWGGVAFPLFVFTVLFAWPSLERRLSGDKRRHDLLDRPRDRPFRTAAAAAFLSWVGLIFFAGASDRIFYRLGISYTAQVHFWRVAIWVLPVVIFFLTRNICRALQRSGTHPMRGWQGSVVRRRSDGALVLIDSERGDDPPPDTEAPVGTVPGKKS